MFFEVDDQRIGDQNRRGVRGVEQQFLPEKCAGFWTVFGVGVVVAGDLGGGRQHGSALAMFHALSNRKMMILYTMIGKIVKV